MAEPPPDQTTRVLAALADPTRRDIVSRLAHGPATLTDLASSYDITVQAVSKHLGILQAAGLIRRTQSGRHRPAHLQPDALTHLVDHIHTLQDLANERCAADDAPSPSR